MSGRREELACSERGCELRPGPEGVGGGGWGVGVGTGYPGGRRVLGLEPRCKAVHGRAMGDVCSSCNLREFLAEPAEKKESE